MANSHPISPQTPLTNTPRTIRYRRPPQPRIHRRVTPTHYNPQGSLYPLSTTHWHPPTPHPYPMTYAWPHTHTIRVVTPLDVPPSHPQDDASRATDWPRPAAAAPFAPTPPSSQAVHHLLMDGNLKTKRCDNSFYDTSCSLMHTCEWFSWISSCFFRWILFRGKQNFLVFIFSFFSKKFNLDQCNFVCLKMKVLQTGSTWSLTSAGICEGVKNKLAVEKNQPWSKFLLF